MDIRTMKLILIRHGEPDYDEIRKAYPCSPNIGKNYAGLTKEGIEQVEAITTDNRLLGADLIITSPYTRALQTASILSQKTHVPLFVEIDLREWMSEYSKQFNSSEEFWDMMNEFTAHKGEYDNTCVFKWESLSSLGERCFSTVRKYMGCKKIIVVSHQMVINQFCLIKDLPYCGIVEKDFNANTLWNGFIENF